MPDADWGLPYAYWHGDPDDMVKWRPLKGRSQMVVRSVGPYVVRSWLDKDGRVIATGWFTV